MIHSFRKFFEFAGRQSRNWYLGLFYEIIRCILEALQFAALLVVLDGLVHDNITAQTALLAFGIMLVSVIGTAIFWYLAHGKEGEGSYRMCEDKRIQIGNRMKYMPMGYFNSHSLGNLTSVSTATMSDLESMSFAVIVRTLVGVIHASIFSVAMSYFSWKISLIFLTGVILFMVINTMLLRCSKRLSPIRLDAQTEFMDAVLEYIQGMSVVRAFHMLQRLDEVSVPITKHAEIFNGIQTSAERPTPIYWFSSDEIVAEYADTVEISRDGNNYTIEKALLRPYFKPTKKAEKGLNSYSILATDKQIIFPYDNNGHLIRIDEMQSSYPGTYAYLLAHYDRLVPKCVSRDGTRDVPNATADTWYQYGRTQALTAFINTPKLIVGVLSKEPMYAMDTNDTLIASGGTAGYCAVSKKDGSPYALEYIKAWLSNPITERILEIVGSDFEGGFTARGTFVLSTLPFVELDFAVEEQKAIHDRVVAASREIYEINDALSGRPAKRIANLLQRQKETLISEIQGLIDRVYLIAVLSESPNQQPGIFEPETGNEDLPF